MTQPDDGTPNLPSKRHWRALVGVCLFVVAARVYLSLVLGSNARYRWEFPKSVGETLVLVVGVVLASLAGAIIGRRSLGKPTAIALATVAGGLVTAAYNGLIGAALGLLIGSLVASSLARRAMWWFVQSVLAVLWAAAAGVAALWFDADLSDGPCPATCLVLALSFVGFMVMLRWRATQWPGSRRWVRWTSGASLLLFMTAGVWSSFSLDMLRRVDHLAKTGRQYREMAIRPLSKQWFWPGPIAVQYLTVGPDATDDDLRAMRGWKELNGLTIESDKISDAGLENVAQFNALSSLSLVSPHVTDEGLRHLEGMNAIRWLDLDRARITGKGIDRLTQTMSLQMLSLADSTLQDDDLAICAPLLLGVSRLDLGGTQITDAGLQCLAPMARLRYLKLARTSITANGIEPLSKLPNLIELDLSQTCISDDDLAALEQLPLPKHLSFEDTPISDRGAASLARLPVVWLNLRRTRIGDAGMDELSKSNTLQYLDVQESRVTEDGVNRFKARRQDCNVWWGQRSY